MNDRLIHITIAYAEGKPDLHEKAPFFYILNNTLYKKCFCCGSERPVADLSKIAGLKIEAD